MKDQRNESFRSLVDAINVNVRALKVLGKTSDEYGIFLSEIILSRVPPALKLLWARKDKRDADDVNELIQFLEEELKNREEVFDWDQKQTTTKPLHQSIKSSTRSNATSTLITYSHAKRSTCPMCEEDHFINQCTKYQELKPEQRIQEIRKFQLCSNCLKPHKSNCLSSQRCKECNGKHHTTLHLTKETKKAPLHSTTTHTVAVSQTNCLLPILSAQILTKQTSMIARILIDTGSQISFITKNLSNKLKCNTINRELLDLKGFQDLSKGQNTYAKVEFVVKGQNTNIALQAVEIPHISSYHQPYQFSFIDKKEFSNIKFVNIDNTSNCIDIIIGMDQYGKVMTGQQKVINGDTVLMETICGWIISGRLSINCTHVIHSESKSNCPELWELEHLGITETSTNRNTDEIQWLESYENTIAINSEDRYEVRLLWKDQPSTLNSFYSQAMRRLAWLTKKLQRDYDLLTIITKFSKNI